jgi:hypothetical protein
MVILYLKEITDKFVYLLLADLQTVVQLLIHYLSQLELL